MTASQLLATLANRGATTRSELNADGEPVLVITPRSAIGDLLPELQKFKPAILELLASDPATVAVEAATAPDDDERARELLAKYRAGGAVLTLEEIEHDGATWSAIGCDLTNVSPAKRERAFEQMKVNRRVLQRALELERIALK